MAKTRSNSETILSQFITAEKGRFPASITESQFFEIFAAQQVLKTNDLNDKEIQDGIVGEGNDGGIDGLYFFINGQIIQEDIKSYDHWIKNIHLEIFVIQAKTTNGFGEDAIHKLVNTTEDLFTMDHKLNSKEFKERYHPELLEIAERIRKGYLALVSKGITFRFNYFYATQGEDVHNNTKGLTKKLEKKIKELFSDASFDFTFLGARELLEIVNRRPSEKIEIKATKPILYSDEQSYVCLVKLRDFYQFIEDKDTKRINRHIFEANVRDYQGDVSVNKEIRGTLQTPGGENFWWLNNGITILATSVTPRANMGLILESPEIVNGLQTSNEVYNYFSSVSLETLAKEERDILLRIIVPADGKSRDKIIKATNSQTKIPPYALKSTDPVHWDIEQYLKAKGLFYDRRKNFYKNQGKPQAEIVNITELAQAMIAIKLRRPDDARARPSSIIGNEKEYTKIFSRNIPLQLYHAVLQIMDKVTAYFSSNSLIANERTNLRYYVAYYAVCLTCTKAFPNDDDILAASDALTPAILGEVLRIVKAYYEKAGGDDNAAKGTDFLEALSNELLAKYFSESAKKKAIAKSKAGIKKEQGQSKVAAKVTKVKTKAKIGKTVLLKKRAATKSGAKKKVVPKKRAVAKSDAKKKVVPKKRASAKSSAKGKDAPRKKATVKPGTTRKVDLRKRAAAKSSEKRKALPKKIAAKKKQTKKK
jgi:hypothetical protein